MRGDGMTGLALALEAARIALALASAASGFTAAMAREATAPTLPARSSGAEVRLAARRARSVGAPLRHVD
jgi:hypothetical protein